MRKLLFAALLGVLASPCAHSQMTTITASHIAQDLSGTLLSSGQLCLTPVGLTGVPTGFQASGVQYVPQQTCVPVTNGAISGFTVPDTVDINPPGVGYKIAVTDLAGNTLLTYAQPIFPTGASWSLDTWSPTQTVTVPSPTTVNYSVNAPQGRCGVNPAIDYTATTIYTCINQIWVPVVSSSGALLTAASIAAALTYTPVSPAVLSAAISALPALTAANIDIALDYTPSSPSDVTNAINSALAGYIPLGGGKTITGEVKTTFTPSDPMDIVNKLYVDNLVSSTSFTATPTFSPAAGSYSGVQSVSLADVTAGATIFYCVSPTGNCGPNVAYVAALTVTATETICAHALSGTGGVISTTSCNVYTITTPPPPTGTGIGTILVQGYLTDGTIPFKTCYTGSTACSGGVSGTPAATPTHSLGGSTPSAGTGVANAVANFNLQIGTTGSFTSALWTPSNSPSGFGSVPTATNYYRDFWIKTSFPPGPSRIEFDTQAFDGGWDWMFGTQCNSDKNLIQTDNQGDGWVYSSMPCGVLFDGNYHHVQFTFHRTLAADRSCPAPGGTTGVAPCECWDTGTIDGKSTAINVCKRATTSTWTGSGGQHQIDGEPTTASSGTPAIYNEWVDSDLFIAGLADTSGGNPGTPSPTPANTGDLDSFNFDGSSSIPSDLTVVGSPAISTAQEHTATNSLHLPSGLNYVKDSINPVSQIYTRQYIYINTESSGSSDGLLRFYHGGTEMFVYYLSSSGLVAYFDQASSANLNVSSTPFPTGGWHLLETFTRIHPTAGHVTVKVDGTQIYDSGVGTMNTGSATIDTVWFGQIGNTPPTGWDSYMDNVDFDDTNWIGPI